MKLDGDHLDVYRDAHALIITVDMTRRDTWVHAQVLLDSAPHQVPTLLLANFRDAVGVGRNTGAVSLEEMEDYAAKVTAARVKAGAPRAEVRVHCFECSLRECYGLKVLFNYLNIPFLRLKLALLRDAVTATKSELATVRSFCTRVRACMCTCFPQTILQTTVAGCGG